MPRCVFRLFILALYTSDRCLESISSMDRRSQFLQFSLTADQAQKLISPASVTTHREVYVWLILSLRPRYQLRLFCTSSTFYTSSPLRPSPICPVEFPPTCEVRVNGVQLSANLKGLKKKPGTAPPADLGKSVRTSTGAVNRVEMIYVNSQQPVQSKVRHIRSCVCAPNSWPEVLSGSVFGRSLYGGLCH